jgi:transposase
MATGKRYPEDFKVRAVKMVTEDGMKQAQVARNLGVNPNSIGKWLKKYGNQEIPEVSADEAMRKARQLEKENAELREENEILKKAAAFVCPEES